jgi:hypothetical protein
MFGTTGQNDRQRYKADQGADGGTPKDAGEGAANWGHHGIGVGYNAGGVYDIISGVVRSSTFDIPESSGFGR